MSLTPKEVAEILKKIIANVEETTAGAKKVHTDDRLDQNLKYNLGITLANLEVIRKDLKRLKHKVYWEPPLEEEINAEARRYDNQQAFYSPYSPAYDASLSERAQLNLKEYNPKSAFYNYQS